MRRPDEREPAARLRLRQHPRHERQRGRQRARDADALQRPGRDERQRRAAGLDARQEEQAAREEVRDPARGEQPQPAEGVHEAAADDRGRDLDEGRRPDDETDRGVRDGGSGEGQRERGRVPVEARLDEEQRDGEADDGQGHVGSGLQGGASLRGSTGRAWKTAIVPAFAGDSCKDRAVTEDRVPPPDDEPEATDAEVAEVADPAEATGR